ncbi:MAG: hypothetical protein KDH17_09775 [Rhodocyclaceae bacterium]|nr:hypothetical protein [Rhodocyclaceae bacterium]
MDVNAMAIRVWLLPSLLVPLTVLALSSGVAAQCQVGIAAPPTEPERPNHHPIGRSLPLAADFRQPDGCTDAFWFFDDDRDGKPDRAETRVFGPDRQVICASCHDAMPPADSAVATQTYLRRDPATLCLTCHAL